jgi:hypothetical protein
VLQSGVFWAVSFDYFVSAFLKMPNIWAVLAIHGQDGHSYRCVFGRSCGIRLALPLASALILRENRAATHPEVHAKAQA